MAAMVPLLANGATAAATLIAPHLGQVASATAKGMKSMGSAAKPVVTKALTATAQGAKAMGNAVANTGRETAKVVVDSTAFAAVTQGLDTTDKAIRNVYDNVAKRFAGQESTIGGYDSMIYSITDLITIAIVIVLLCMIFYLADKGVQQIFDKHF